MRICPECGAPIRARGAVACSACRAWLLTGHEVGHLLRCLRAGTGPRSCVVCGWRFAGRDRADRCPRCASRTFRPVAPAPATGGA